ncbi:MAG: SURF1 family protein [Alphaproteobacteria bacterium]
MPRHIRLALTAFRPTLWPTLFTIPALILLIGLGSWQVERLHWKEDLIATRTARSSGPSSALPADTADPAGYEFSKTRVTGYFLNDKEMYLAARSLNGNTGFHVVTPFVLADGSAILVDRGWIPLERKDPATRPAGELAGEVTILALLRASQRQNWLVPDNEPQHNVWFYVDVPAMARAAGLAQVRPYFIEAGRAPNPGGYPIGGQSHIDLPNNHLQYALTWYSFAVSLTVIYLLYHRNLAREAAAKAAGATEESHSKEA